MSGRKFGRRAFLVWTASACLLGIGMPAATGGKRISSRIQTQEQLHRTLTVAERAAYQYAIEEVYWRHRIWPKENPGPKPLLDAIVSQRQIEAQSRRVPAQIATYRRSTGIANHWERTSDVRWSAWPVTADSRRC